MWAFVFLFLFFSLHFLSNAAAENLQDYFPLNEGRTAHFSYEKKRIFTYPNGILTGKTILGTNVGTVLRRQPNQGERSGIYSVQEIFQEKFHPHHPPRKLTVNMDISIEPKKALLHSLHISGYPGLLLEPEQFAPPTLIFQLSPTSKHYQNFSSYQAYGLNIKVRAVGQSIESVTVPGGSFSDCLKISGEGAISGRIPGLESLSLSEGKVEQTYWLAKGIGIVKYHHIIHARINGQKKRDIQVLAEETKRLTRLVPGIPEKGVGLKRTLSPFLASTASLPNK